MFQSLSNSWRLVKASAAVLRADKELIIFPLISAIGVLLVTATFALPMFFAGLFDSLFSGGSNGILFYAVLFLYYVVQYTVIIFANAALVGAAMIRLEGGDPTVGDGVRVALDHFSQIMGFAVFSATVGIILRALSQRDGLGRFVASLVGMAWNLAIFLAVPVLVVENVGPWEAITRSTALLKRTWGEQIAGNFGVGLIFMFIYIALIILGILAVMLAIPTQTTPLIISVVLLVIFAFVLVALAQSTLSGIYTAAVYQFAATGKTGDFFDESLVKNAFKQK